MSAFKAYERYKPSGVKWLGDVPEHWKVSKIGYEYAIQLGKMLQPEPKLQTDVLKPYLRSANIAWEGVKLDDIKEMWFNQSEILKYKLLKDDVVLSEGGDVGRASYWNNDNEMYIQNAIIRLRSNLYNSNSTKFIYYFLSLIKKSGWIDILCNSNTIAHYTAEKVTATVFLKPTFEEQTIIAQYLDQKTAQIDALIAKKQQLLNKLAEQRTALISHAVTKGLNPDAPLKKSGVEWLGDVPEHWEVKRLKFLVSEPLKYGANESAELTDTDLPRYIRITDVKDDGSLWDDTFRSLMPEVAEEYLLSEGDILLARSGATVGKNFIYRKSWGIAAYAGYLIRARMDVQIMNADFTYLFLQSHNYWSWLRSVIIQATIQNVSAEKYNNVFLPVPSLHEQDEIISTVNTKTAELDQMVAKVKTVIQKLKEYRAALITQAVTGKIDIRSLV